MKRSALLLPALALALGAALAGCGGSDDDALTHDEFVTQAEKICADGNDELEAAAADLDPSNPDDVTSFVNDALIPNIQDQHDAIEELSPPEDDQDAVDDMLSALQGALDALADDPMAITTDPEIYADANAAADELGLTECGSE